MTVTLSQAHIFVDDPDAALPFYCDALGLIVRNEVENEGFRWLVLGSDEQPEISVVLSQPQAGRSPENGEALAALLAKGELSPVHFAVDDLAAVFERLAAVPGAEVVQEPADQFWGLRDAAVRDPAGNLLRIEQAR